MQFELIRFGLAALIVLESRQGWYNPKLILFYYLIFSTYDEVEVVYLKEI
jgi:hypothetical protein